LSAVGVFVYIFGVAWLGFHSQQIFGRDGSSFFIPLFALLLFVISASVTSLLVLGKPIMLYLEGARKQAVILLLATLGWLIAFLLVVATTLILI